MSTAAVATVPAEALAIEALIVAVQDAIDVCADDDRREQLRGWEQRLTLELSGQLAAA